MRADATALTRHTNNVWSIATKAPLFLRKAKMVGTGKSKKRATMIRDGKEVEVPVKTNRCIKKIAIRTMLSAAAQSAAKTLADEAAALGVGVLGETPVAYALPSISKGGELALEHALSSYAQTIFDSAVRIKASMATQKAPGVVVPLHKKVTAGCMLAACEIVNDRMFSCVGLAPGQVTLLPPKSKKAASQKKAKESAAGATGTTDGA